MTKAATKTAAVAATKPVAAAAKKDAAVPVVVADKALEAVEGVFLVRTKKGVARRCRSGLVFGPEATPVQSADLSDEQLQAILDDQLLVTGTPDETEAVA